MTNGRTLILLLGALATSGMSGCASQYFGDPGCHVNCRYCAAPPLPYASYSECACHSCAASPYLAFSPEESTTPSPKTLETPLQD